ncbi:MAG: hypothetical protein WA126_13365 [Thermodesulfovibrionales bacterium]
MFLTKLCGWLISILKYILKVVFGRLLDDKRDAFSYLRGYKKEDMQLTSDKTISFWGYRASINIVVSFSFLILLLFFLFKPFLSAYFSKEITSDFFIANGIIAVAFLFIGLWVLDHLIPIVLFTIINGLIKLRFKLSLVKVRIG